ncbi:MAG: DUF2318 domain-containing protein [Spirochaetaceae bacterium]|jgi:uncharacterized membrane protein|nr:DUF2318 domain-containing protein [Spirochaetaceae bacterium]
MENVIAVLGGIFTKTKKHKALVLRALLPVMGFALLGQRAEQNVLKPVIADRDLVIRISEVTENAVFYPVDIEGTRIEVLAVRAPDGTIRTAFNTCKICYNSGRGFYKQQGTVLVCQNCGTRFRMSQVGLRAGGCNPVPIFPENKTVTDATITISKEFLKKEKIIFARWRRS